MMFNLAPLAFRLESHELLPSTSALVREAAEAGAAEGLAVLAHRQDAGRGRQGRGWESPIGNLYLSILLRPAIALQAAPQWSFVAAVAVAETLRGFLPDPQVLALKWPNDVLLGGAKVAGILVETGISDSQALDWVCIGIGVNIALAPILPDRPTACVAQFTPQPPPIETFANMLLERLAYWHTLRLQHGFAPLRQAWLAYGPALATPITIRRHGGMLEGQFAGLSPEGGLLLACQGQVQNIVAGEIT